MLTIQAKQSISEVWIPNMAFTLLLTWVTPLCSVRPLHSILDLSFSLAHMETSLQLLRRILVLEPLQSIPNSETPAWESMSLETWNAARSFLKRAFSITSQRTAWVIDLARSISIPKACLDLSTWVSMTKHATILEPNFSFSIPVSKENRSRLKSLTRFHWYLPASCLWPSCIF